MAFHRLNFSKRWTNPSDYPSIQTDETRVRADMQSLHDETLAGLNKLAEELEAEGAGANIGVRMPAASGSTAKGTVQKAIDALSRSIQLGGAVPGGGATGQVLGKASDEDNDLEWRDPIPAYLKEENVLSTGTKALFGLGADAVPDDAFAFLGKYNQHWWERRINKAVIQLGEVENATLSAATSTSATDEVIYSDGITIDAATGGVSLSEPTTTITCSYSKYTNANVLAGKYFINYQDELYYAKPTAKAVQSSESSYYYSEIPASVVTATQKLGEWENLISSDRNAYPDSGISDGFEWQYLGIPFDNAVTAPKIVTGSYIGTGKYGTSNKNTLTFDSEPKMVFVTEEFREDDGSAYTSTGWVIFTQTDVMGYAYSNHSFGNESAFSMTPNWGKVLKWWSTDSADVQGNTAGTKYRYVAIC